MDMPNAYAAWAGEALPAAAIVYDHFHVVKSMNDKLDQNRRKAMRGMAKQVRGHIEGILGCWTFAGAGNASTEIGRASCRERV